MAKKASASVDKTLRAIGLHNVGVCYYAGIGTDINVQTADQYFQRSTRMSAYGPSLYARGLLTDKKYDETKNLDDLKLATSYFCASEKYQYALASETLGYYAQSKTLLRPDKDPITYAYEFRLKAAQRGYAPAEYLIGESTRSNLAGYDEDISTLYLVRAARQNYSLALKKLKNLNISSHTIFYRPTHPDMQEEKSVREYNLRIPQLIIESRSLKQWNRQSHLRFHPHTTMEHQLTEGDTHGNACRIASTLVEVGIADISVEDQESFVEMYEKEHKEIYSALTHLFDSSTLATALSTDDLKKLDAIFGHLNSESKWVPGKSKIISRPLLRFMGDLFAERGANDIFNKKIIEFLSYNKVPFEILWSNHDSDFFSFIFPEIYKEWKVIHANGMHNSIFKLLGLINTHPEYESKESVQRFIELHLIPHLKLVSYCLSTDKTTIYFFMHSQRGLRTIFRLGRDLGIDVSIEFFERKETLMILIDNINANFKKLITTPEGRKNIFKMRSIYQLAWGRTVNDTCDPSFDITAANFSPEFLKGSGYSDEKETIVDQLKDGTKTMFMSGHNSDSLNLPQQFTLDNTLGKQDLQDGVYKGWHTVGSSGPQPPIKLGQEAKDEKRGSETSVVVETATNNVVTLHAPTFSSYKPQNLFTQAFPIQGAMYQRFLMFNSSTQRQPSSQTDVVASNLVVTLEGHRL